jgi:hypothetical protein
MTIYAISRESGNAADTVNIATTDNYATISATGYILAQQSVINDVNDGAFTWRPTDTVKVSYIDTNGDNQSAFFTYDESTGSLIADTTEGLGTMAYQNANNVNITGGSVVGTEVDDSPVGSNTPSTGAFTDLTSSTFNVGTSTEINAIIDDDTFATATDENVATAESTAAYIAGANKGLGSVQVFTSSDTWNKPAGCRFVEVEVVGGGGSSGAIGATASGEAAEAGGGGGGGYSRRLIDVTAISSETITVGAGGAAPAAGVNNGNTGGTSSFGSHASATGGGGGTGMASTTSGTAGGGAGGVGSNGDINIDGEFGGPGRVLNLNPSVTVQILTYGGASQLSPAAPSNPSGFSGIAYGGGATGPYGSNTAAKAGQAGAPGVVIVYEYY